MKKLVLLLLLLTGMMNISAQNTIQDIANLVVLIGIVENGEIVGNGSGTIVTPDGLIYTNRHVVEDADDLAIFILEDIQELPVLTYMASVEFTSEEIDFAMIRIDRDANGNPIDRQTLNLPYLLIDPADVTIGDFVRVFGYPSIGDGYMVVTSGEIVTIQNGNVGGERVPLWYRTDTEFSGGNSGGLALNEAGQVVGIPTWVVTEDRTSGKLGGILPISTVLRVAEMGDIIVDRTTTTTEAAAFTINNTSDITVCYVFISPTTATSWGDDQLDGQEVIAPGTTRTWDLDADFYDVLLKDCDRADISDTRNVEVSGQVSFDFTGRDLNLTDQRDQLSQSEIAGVPGIGITCDFDDGASIAVENGVELVLIGLDTTASYTATVLGIDGFDPVMAAVDTDTRLGACADDIAEASEYQADFPTSGVVEPSEFNPQVTFTPTGLDVSVIAGGYDNAPGEFLIVVEGLTLTADSGRGNLFAVRLTPNLLEAGVPLAIYLLANTNSLDMMMYLAEPVTLEPFVTPGGLVVQCDNAGDADSCWGDTFDLSPSNVTVQTNRRLPGGPLDSMLIVPLTGLEIDPEEDLYFNFVATSQQETTGPYTLVVHVGTS